MLKFGACTDPGRVRENNEDSYRALPEIGLFMVADGVGGQEAGEVASRIAVDAIVAAFTPHESGGASAIDAQILLRTGALSAHEAVTAEGRRRRESIATTLTVAYLDGGQATFVHVGDSAVYIVDEQGARQLSTDHTVVGDLVRERAMKAEDAKSHPQRHVITKALGANGPLDPDVFSTTLPAGSTLVLCTDGLTDFVSDDSLARIVQNTKDPQETADRLVAAANRNGGGDNITVVVVKIPGEEQRKKSRAKGAIAALVVFVLLTGGATAGANWYLNHRFFIGEKDGRIAIFRGVPNTVAGRLLSQPVQVTSFPASVVPAPYDERIHDGIPATDLDDARGRLAQLTAVETTGPQLAFVREKRLFILPLTADGRVREGAHEIQVYQSTNDISHVMWEWNGSLLSFSSGNKQMIVSAKANARAIGLTESDWPFHADSSARSNAIRHSVDSPDGRYSITRVGEPTEWVAELKDRRTLATIRLSHIDLPLSWSPDSRWLLFRWHRKARVVGDSPAAEIWTVSANGTSRRRIADGDDARFAPDGNHVLVFGSERATGTPGWITVTDLNGRNVITVVKETDNVFAICWGNARLQ